MARHKYNARQTIIDGITFQSAREARRYQDLKYLEMAGAITNLELQPKWILQPGFKNGKRKIRPITYTADFKYLDLETGQVVIEDVKGVKTEVFKIKQKMMLYVHEIEVKTL